MQIPAKTFLIGEYAALLGESAIILTTEPCFELSVINTPELIEINSASPAGILWRASTNMYGLKWYDPYFGLGGLGASTAQFIGAYLGHCQLTVTQPNHQDLLASYFECAYFGTGLKPSAYDLLAQTKRDCVYVNNSGKVIKIYAWPFCDLGFLLLHTNKKLATHEHLQVLKLPAALPQLVELITQAQLAFAEADSDLLINAINGYQQVLINLQLCAAHSIKLVEELRSYKEILACKGCGALGADVIIVILATSCMVPMCAKLRAQGWKILATHNQLYSGAELL